MLVSLTFVCVEKFRCLALLAIKQAGLGVHCVFGVQQMSMAMSLVPVSS